MTALAHRFDGPDDAPVLVLSNSLGTAMALWDGVVAPLADEHRVLRYDHRGHGASGVPPGPYTVDELVADVVALVDGLGIERFAFCGISLGGVVGMSLAAAHPARIEGLVLACTSPRFLDAAAWLERAAIVRADGCEAIADAVLARWLTPQSHVEQPGVVHELRDLLVATPREGYAGCCEALAAFDFKERLGEVTAPTLVIAGAEDPSVSPDVVQLLVDGIPNARLAVLDGAAHLAHLERPGAFVEAVRSHLRVAA